MELFSEDNRLSLTTMQHRWQLGNAGALRDGPPLDPGALGDLRGAGSSLPSVYEFFVDGIGDDDYANHIREEA